LRLFFQAEDGIRDLIVTGVQTCALPISRGFIGPAGLVNDGITRDCQNNSATTWTYNQGVILGGLAALSEITGDRGYLAQGDAIEIGRASCRERVEMSVVAVIEKITVKDT